MTSEGARGEAGPDAASDAVDLIVNGEAFSLPGGGSISDLLRTLARHPRTVAVERNGEIVPRARYDDVDLCSGDRLEIVQFVQGG